MLASSYSTGSRERVCTGRAGGDVGDNVVHVHRTVQGLPALQAKKHRHHSAKNTRTRGHESSPARRLDVGAAVSTVHGWQWHCDPDPWPCALFDHALARRRSRSRKRAKPKRTRKGSFRFGPSPRAQTHQVEGRFHTFACSRHM